jgi:hypothetical protein
MQTGSSGTLIGWKSGQTTFVPLWDRMEGAWLRVQGIEEGRAASKVLIWQFLSTAQQEVSADVIQNSAVGIFSP